MALPILARQDETQGFVDIGVTVFNIVIEELQASPEISRVANLDIVIASYIALSKIVGSHGASPSAVASASMTSHAGVQVGPTSTSPWQKLVISCRRQNTLISRKQLQYFCLK